MCGNDVMNKIRHSEYMKGHREGVFWGSLITAIVILGIWAVIK